MASIQRLLHQRIRLLGVLERVEMRRALGLDRPRAPVPSPWRFHSRRRPSSRCVALYVAAVLRALPDLAWSEEDRERRRELLRELHDAYANEDLSKLGLLGRLAQDRPEGGAPEDAIRRKLQFHVSWLVDHLAEARERATRSS